MVCFLCVRAFLLSALNVFVCSVWFIVWCCMICACAFLLLGSSTCVCSVSDLVCDVVWFAFCVCLYLRVFL